MKIIIPMAGMGKRMRPHTLTIPKPLIPLAGKAIVHRLIEEVMKFSDSKVEEIAFIIGDFGKETEGKLLEIASSVGAKGKLYYQREPLGTAHALLCAGPSLQGPALVAFADTLFRTAPVINDTDCDGTIWVSKVEDPSAFGVVKTDENLIIKEFIEKPSTPVSDLAIIGIYYFKDAAFLKNEMQALIDNNVVKGGEYQLTDALQNMMNKNARFNAKHIDEWLDCGNKDATVYANKRILDTDTSDLVSSDVVIDNSLIIKPCYIGKGVKIVNSVIGPYASVGQNTMLVNSVIKNSIIQNNSVIKNVVMNNSMLGNNVEFIAAEKDVSIGDFTVTA